ncbi:hypothetical protein [Hafnia paralvei]|uniref:hypothetical protein n=1 Tax=Hafnia paralvei TaxID=546367 RepID=UPI00210EFCE6|nr:hypothetical protein [Hafnia paralvei]MCQ4171723.1 hypothetical protein [Hafnia paralvei]
MKFKHIFYFTLLVVSSSVLAESNIIGDENALIQQATKDGYQAQRNLAFGYKVGKNVPANVGYLQKNAVKACAWRKILLIANPNKIDSSDSMNEREDCRKLDFHEDEKVWHIVHQYLPIIESMKKNGQYMLKSNDKESKDDNLVIIDVDD